MSVRDECCDRFRMNAHTRVILWEQPTTGRSALHRSVPFFAPERPQLREHPGTLQTALNGRTTHSIPHDGFGGPNKPYFTKSPAISNPLAPRNQTKLNQFLPPQPRIPPTGA
jgi:hypothetical protein